MNDSASPSPSRQTSSRPWLIVGLLLLLLGGGVWGFLLLLAPEKGTWWSVGVVEAVGEEFVVIRHGTVPALPGAQSTAFFVASKTLLDGVKPGDRVRFVAKSPPNERILIGLEIRR